MSFAPGGTPDDFYGPDWRDGAVDAGWLDPDDIPASVLDILEERERQQDIEGWTPEHDDRHIKGELATAAALYAFPDRIRAWSDLLAQFWPWDGTWWKPADRRRNLVKAGALIAAEIERLDRLNEDSQ